MPHPDWASMWKLLKSAPTKFWNIAIRLTKLPLVAAPNVSVIPAHIDLVAIEIELVDKENRNYVLKQALESVKKTNTITSSSTVLLR